MTFGHRHGTVLLDMAGRTRFATGIVPVARGDAAALIGPERHVYLRVYLRGLDGLHVPDIVPGRSVRRLGAILGAVDLAHPERVDTELASQFIDAAFDRERADRRAGCPVGGNLGAIAQNIIADRLGVRQVVDRKSANAALLNRRPWKRARLVFEHGLRGGDPAVLLGADLDLDDRGRGWPGGPEHLLAAHHDLDRPARLLRQHVRDRLQIDDRLAAKPSTDLGGDRADVGDVAAADPRGVGADHELALARAPDLFLCVRRHRDEAGMRFDISLVNRLRRVAPLDDHFGLGKPRLHVTFGETDHLGDVRRLGRFGVDTRGQDVVVQYRRIGRHRSLDIHDVRQYLVFDLDQIERLIGDRRRDCGDRGDRMTLVQRLAFGHAVAGQVPQVMRRGADDPPVRRDIREVGARRHGLNPG